MTISNCALSFPKATKERNRESRLDVLLFEIPDTSFLSSGMTISNCVLSFPKATKERNRESRLDSVTASNCTSLFPKAYQRLFLSQL